MTQQQKEIHDNIIRSMIQYKKTTIEIVKEQIEHFKTLNSNDSWCIKAYAGYINYLADCEKTLKSYEDYIKNL